VTFSGGGQAAIKSWSDTQIVATVPTGTTTGSVEASWPPTRLRVSSLRFYHSMYYESRTIRILQDEATSENGQKAAGFVAWLVPIPKHFRKE